MIVSPDNLYHSELSLPPVRSEKDDLEFVDIIASFASAHEDIRIPTELVLPRIPDDEQCRLFVEGLELIETCQHFLIRRKVLAWINLTPAVANILLSDTELASQVERFSLLELTTSESYPELNKGKDNPILTILVVRFPLVLTNYGSGGILTRAIFDDPFKRVVLDKNPAQQRIAHISPEPSTQAILTQLSPGYESTTISGIDTQGMLERVLLVGFSVMQGGLWPAMSLAQITSFARI